MKTFILSLLALGLVMLGLFIATKVNAIECVPINVCVKEADQTRIFNETWTQYGSVEMIPIFPMVCTGTTAMVRLEIEYSPGLWKNISSTSTIKLISGSINQTIGGQFGGSCNANITPRATWTLQATQIGSFNLRIRGMKKTGIVFSNFMITVNPGEPIKNNYFLTGTEINGFFYYSLILLYWFLGILIILGLIRLIL